MVKKKSNLVIEWSVLITIAVIWFCVGFLVSNNPHPYEQTLDTCIASHKVINGGLEDLCGRLQDETNTEFICDSYDVNAHCSLKINLK